MKKEVGLLLAGAACFDLGNVTIADAAVTPKFEPIIISSMSTSDFYLKLDITNLQASANTCLGKGGKVVRYKGSDYCEIPKAKAK